VRVPAYQLGPNSGTDLGERFDEHRKYRAGALRAQASRIPEHPFVWWRGRRVSYGEFDARTDALAGGLVDLGIQPGDVVSVMLPNCLEFLEAWWAILKAWAAERLAAFKVPRRLEIRADCRRPRGARSASPLCEEFVRWAPAGA
jgi:non-ribosomal peptide synthetase component E (peptide arylation enzyme)